MQLKRLEIYGFKSFADKTVIEFPTGLTAIVGPNGSGKSNVADAIRWVLGEQSAKELRGEKVEDFIFSGSNERRRLGFAQVSLTFDNSDGFLQTEFNEVTVTRKAYRTGESEYYINKSRTRLKDIQELFLDTGLGRNSFAMISQGQVESIVEAKPKDRRLLFDEAAGINKYKAKKEETLRKLQKTELDLSRAKDIAFELEQRLEPLEVQKEKANRYLELADNLKKSKEKLVSSEYFTQKRAFCLAKEQKSEREDQLVALDNKFNSLEAYGVQKKEDLQLLEEELQSKQTKLYEIEQNLQNIASDLRVSKERQEHLKNRSLRSKEVLESRVSQLEIKKKDIEKALSFEESLSLELEEIKTLLAQKQSELENYLQSQNQNQEEIEKTKDLLFEKIQEISLENNKKVQFEREIELTQNAYDKGAAFYKEKETELLIKGKEAKEYKEKIDAVNERNLLKEKAIKAQIELLKTKEEEYVTNREAIQQAEETLREKTARYKALQATETELHGYHHGVKAVLKASLPGVLGAVAQLIEVDENITKAAEAVLGTQLQGVVTLSDVAAEKAIAYLREKRLGKATFYPLNLLEVRPLPDSDRYLLKSPGVLGLLKDFIRFKSCLDPSFKKTKPDNDEQLSLEVLAEYLGGRTFITDNLESARLLAKKSNSRYRIVTLAGEVIWSGGTMTGGEEREERLGLLKRQTLIEKLKVECKNDSDILLQQKNLLKQLEVSLNNEKNKLKEFEVTLQDGKLELESLKITLKPHLTKIDELKFDLQTTQTEQDKLNKTIFDLQAKCTLICAKKSQLQTEEEELREKLKLLSAKEWTKEPIIRKEYQELKDRETRSKERVSFAKKELALLINEKEELINSFNEIDCELQAIFLDKVKERFNAIKKEKRRSILLLTAASYRKKINQLKLKKTELLQNIDDCEKEIKSLRPLVSEAEQLLREVATELAKLESQMEITLQKIEELEINKEEIDEDKILSKEELSRLIQKIKQLEKEITSLGSVNLGAISEFEEVSQRYHFLNEQIIDLIEAKDDLLQVLTRLDKVSRERFAEAFKAIKVEFERLYVELFGGGEASLTLEDGDILEAGIEIKAQPPGKKLQSIGLLSGGEKALTAIALVFAVISVRKVPFYLFDEIDAPLDEANLERYVGLVKRKVNESQIILITHRRRSMEAASLLYGVTMEEKGVSKILSLRIEDEQAAIAIES